MRKTAQIHRVRTARLAPYEAIDLTIWGETGARQNPASETDPQTYYLRLAVHMAQGGEIPPLEVGYSAWQDEGPKDQVYVFNGNHRLLIAKALGISVLPVINSACEDAVPLSPEEMEGLYK